jgi:hypothetical protein
MDLIEGARMGCMEDGVDGAAAVTREARDDMDVQVGNGLAGRAAIVDSNGERRSPKGMSDAPVTFWTVWKSFPASSGDRSESRSACALGMTSVWPSAIG